MGHGTRGSKAARCALAAALATCALALGAAPAGAANVTQKDTLEPALVKRINQVREAHGLRPLKVVSRLKKAATKHANSMGSEGYFVHELYTPWRSKDWTEFGRWIPWYYPGPDFTSWSAGENLAWGAPDLGARKTVRMWMNSTGHRANLLAPKWRHVGVSAVHVTNPGGDYAAYDEVTIVAADFGRRS